MENKETVNNSTITVDGIEFKESEMNPNQRYLTSQCKDLMGKKARIEFELDQIQASLNVFQQALIEATKEKASEVLNPEDKKSKENNND